MGIFKDWAKRRLKESEGESPADNFRFNQNDTDYAHDHDHMMQELIKLVSTKYHDDLMQFLHGIAGRGDTEVASLVRKLERGQQFGSVQKPQHPKDKDEYMPPISDTGAGDDSES